MYLNKINKIIIFGGGTSGWLTAAFLTNNLLVPTEITLIEDTSLGPIGVGEGTQPFTAKFLSRCGIHPKMWMKDSNASFKYGVELDGWTDEPGFRIIAIVTVYVTVEVIASAFAASQATLL